jgi:hypothetical protein
MLDHIDASGGSGLSQKAYCLEEGAFEVSAPNGGSIFWPELMMIIEGISLEKVKKRKHRRLGKDRRRKHRDSRIQASRVFLSWSLFVPNTP